MILGCTPYPQVVMLMCSYYTSLCIYYTRVILLDCAVYPHLKELYILHHVYVTRLYVLPTNRAAELYILHKIYATGLDFRSVNTMVVSL